MKTKSISLKEAVQENRDNLKKQNEWAIKVSKKDFMSDIQIDEKQYGYGPREKLDIIYKKSLKDEKKPVLFYIHGAAGFQVTRSRGVFIAENMQMPVMLWLTSSMNLLRRLYFQLRSVNALRLLTLFVILRSNTK